MNGRFTIEFHPNAPKVVRVAVVLMCVASALDSAAAVWSRWPSAHGFLELWRAVVSPVIWLFIGLAFARGLARLTTWLYWITVMLWIPLFLIGIAAFGVATVRGPASQDNFGAPDVLFTISCVLELIAAILLLTKSSRRAFQSTVAETAGRVT